MNDASPRTPHTYFPRSQIKSRLQTKKKYLFTCFEVSLTDSWGEGGIKRERQLKYELIRVRLWFPQFKKKKMNNLFIPGKKVRLLRFLGNGRVVYPYWKVPLNYAAFGNRVWRGDFLHTFREIQIYWFGNRGGRHLRLQETEYFFPENIKILAGNCG